ncbi:MAG: hypothetical protein ACP5M5_13675 [Acidibrevibacterium sp.]
MEFEELADFADAGAHGVPFARAFTDLALAEPEAWREWVCARVKAQRADRPRAEWERARERAEERYLAARYRRTTPFEGAEPFHPAWSSPLPPGHGPNPFLPAWEAAQTDVAACEQRARASVRERLKNRRLRVFGRPGTIEAPWRWIAPHVAAHLKSAGGNLGLGAVEGGGALYFQATVFDPEGVPPDQAAIAYAEQAADPFKIQRLVARMPGAREVMLPPSPLELVLRAIERRCLRDNGRDGAEEAALTALRVALRERLRRGTLLAFRDGASAPLPAEDFAPGGCLGDVDRWDAEPGILVRPPEPPSRTALVAGAEPSSGAVQKTGGRLPKWNWQPFEEHFVNLRQERPEYNESQVHAEMQKFARDHMKDEHNNSPDKKTVWARFKKLRRKECGA